MTRLPSLIALFALACTPEDGMDGTNGVDGQNGVDGTVGLDGQDGMNGADGQDADAIGLLNVTFSGLSDLGPDAAYEGWIIVNGAPVTTGTFHVGSDGYATQSQFLALQSDIDAATTFVLTIEPVPDMDPAPSATHILAGDFDVTGADLSVGHDAALGDDYSTAAGAFILKTPSTAADETDDVNGIWWLDPAAGPAAGFDLPDLTGTGWRYEGWVVGPDGPVSTGIFANGTEADSDEGGPTAGPDGTPPFPGQDFITDGLDLTSGYAAVLTIEPFPDTNPAPFTALKPLTDDDITDVVAPATQAMANTAGDFPIGTVLR